MGSKDDARVVRIAAIGDLHIRTSVPPKLAAEFAVLKDQADILVIAGDITDGGRIVEVELAAELFKLVQLPIVAVLGNHDRRCLRRVVFRRILERSGVKLLEGETTTVEAGVRVGFAGVGGSGGGFWPDEGSPALHHRAYQALAVRARREAARLDAALAGLSADLKVVVTHFAPTTSTLGDEPIVKYPLLGNIELAHVIDRYDVDLVIHGHAHLGNSFGFTTGGTPVRNVASMITGGPIVHDLATDGVQRGSRSAFVTLGSRL